MSNDGYLEDPQPYGAIPQEFDLGVASLNAAIELKDRNDIEGAKNKSKEAIRLFDNCDNDKAKQKANEAKQLLNSLG